MHLRSNASFSRLFNQRCHLVLTLSLFLNTLDNSVRDRHTQQCQTRSYWQQLCQVWLATQKMNRDDKLILCVGLCVLDVIHVCREYPEEDTDRRLVFCMKNYTFFRIFLGICVFSANILAVQFLLFEYLISRNTIYLISKQTKCS